MPKASACHSTAGRSRAAEVASATRDDQGLAGPSKTPKWPPSKPRRWPARAATCVNFKSGDIGVGTEAASGAAAIACVLGAAFAHDEIADDQAVEPRREKASYRILDRFNDGLAVFVERCVQQYRDAGDASERIDQPPVAGIAYTADSLDARGAVHMGDSPNSCRRSARTGTTKVMNGNALPDCPGRSK